MPKEPESSTKPAAKKAAAAIPEVTQGSLDEPDGNTAPLDRTETFQQGTDAQAASAGGATINFDNNSPAPSSPDETQTLDEAQLATKAKKVPAKPAPGGAKASVIGDYRLLKKLGQGGMGAVYKAHQISLDRDCAIKMLSKELGAKPSFVQRFQREAKVMAKLDHPNILRCFEVGEAQGFHYLSMEFVEGGSVEDWLKKLGKFDIGDALHIVIAVARALEHAHELNLIHRDIKPDNILITKKGVIKVADLGLAKATDDDLGLTKTGTGAGTPIYMAPEQARDVKHVDGRCDIYALGVMLYVFLTGEAPFQGTTLVEVIEAKEKGKFKPMRAHNSEVPERLDLIADKMMAKDVKQRYATCTEVVEELEALGLASEQLSFFGGDGTPAPSARRGSPDPAAPTKAPGAASKTKPPAGGAATALTKGSAAKPPLHEVPKVEANIWYWKFTDPKGRPVNKKVTTEEVVTLIKNGSITNKAQLSKTLSSGYRAIGAFSEFETYFRGKIAEKKAGRGADKYKSMLEQIEAEEARKQRWKGLKRIFGNLGSFVGLVVWLAVIAGAIVGGWFLYKKFFP